MPAHGRKAGENSLKIVLKCYYITVTKESKEFPEIRFLNQRFSSMSEWSLCVLMVSILMKRELCLSPQLSIYWIQLGTNEMFLLQSEDEQSVTNPKSTVFVAKTT